MRVSAPVVSQTGTPCLTSRTPTARPRPRRSTPTLLGAKRVRVQHIARAKAEGIPLTMLTAYDALTAPILEAAGVDMLLVGDSLGNVILGHGSTLPVTLEDMERATAAVARSTSRAMIVADLPFGTYEDTAEHAFASASTPHEGRAPTPSSLRAGRASAHIIARARRRPASPCARTWDTRPQSENTLGGPRMQGRGRWRRCRCARTPRPSRRPAPSPSSSRWCPPRHRDASSRRALSIPTIGIGAGPNTDGQVLVWSDMAGILRLDALVSCDSSASSVSALREAASDYVEAVRERSFPGPDNYKND